MRPRYAIGGIVLDFELAIIGDSCETQSWDTAEAQDVPAMASELTPSAINSIREKD